MSISSTVVSLQCFQKTKRDGQAKRYSWCLWPSVVAPTGELKGKALDALVSINCGVKAVSEFAGCVYDGSICSNRGTCKSGNCVCPSGWTGIYCDTTTPNSLGTGGVAAISVVSVFAFLLCLILLVAMAFFVAFQVLRKDEVLHPSLAQPSVCIMYLKLKLRQREDWMIDQSELEMGEILGSGGFGQVHKALWRGTEVAVKTVPSVYSQELRSAFIQEVFLFACLSTCLVPKKLL